MDTGSRTRLTIGALAAGFLLTASPAAAAQTASLPDTTSLPDSASLGTGEPEDLAPLLEPIRKKSGVPALGGAIIRRGGMADLGTVGFRKAGSPVPVTDDDLWHLGSCTKAMTATLIATLVESGKLSWDTTIEDAFPGLRKKIRREWLGVTVQQLLAHRSGLPDDRRPDAKILPELRKLEGPMLQQRRELVRLVLQQKPAARPGTAVLYSNYGYCIAGAVAEAVCGKPWEDLLGERVFEPLGMTSAGFGPPGVRDTLSQPRGHRGKSPVEPGPWADNPAVMGPAATVHCSLRDWGRFVAMELAGARGESRFLDEDTFGKLFTPSGDAGYAFGWMVAERPWADGRVLTHAGSNTMWYAVVWMAPMKDFAVLAVTNQGGNEAAKACDEAAWALIQHVLRENNAGDH